MAVGPVGSRSAPNAATGRGLRASPPLFARVVERLAALNAHVLTVVGAVQELTHLDARAAAVEAADTSILEVLRVISTVGVEGHRLKADELGIAAPQVDSADRREDDPEEP